MAGMSISSTIWSMLIGLTRFLGMIGRIIVAIPPRWYDVAKVFVYRHSRECYKEIFCIIHS